MPLILSVCAWLVANYTLSLVGIRKYLNFSIFCEAQRIWYKLGETFSDYCIVGGGGGRGEESAVVGGRTDPEQNHLELF